MACAIRRQLPALLLLLPLGLAACAGRPGPEVLETVAADPSRSRTVTVYAATTRERNRPGANEFGSARAESTNFSSFDISLPENHQIGEIEWPKGKPDATKSFAVTRQAALKSDDFRRAVSAGSGAKATVFVHGYNYNYQESLFRLAQMASDAEGRRIPILFSWPSIASVRGYVADKDAATFSRDDLAALLISLSKNRSKGDVIVFSHSMGSWLTMEALRTISLQRRTDVLSKLAVVLAAPDIDPDVFATQARMLKGTMARPLTILVSKDDRALRASARLANGDRRIGALDVCDPAVQKTAHDNGVVVLDISSLKAPNALNHDRYIDLAALVPKLNARTGGPPASIDAGTFMFNGIGSGTRAAVSAVSATPDRR